MVVADAVAALSIMTALMIFLLFFSSVEVVSESLPLETRGGGEEMRKEEDLKFLSLSIGGERKKRKKKKERKKEKKKKR